MNRHLTDALESLHRASNALCADLRANHQTLVDHIDKLTKRDGFYPGSMERLHVQQHELGVRFSSMAEMIAMADKTLDPEDIAMSMSEIDEIAMKYVVIKEKVAICMKKHPI